MKLSKREFVSGMFLLMTVGCVEPQANVTQSAAPVKAINTPENVLKQYKITTVKVSVSDKAISHEGLIKSVGNFETEPAHVIKPYYDRELRKTVVPAFVGNVPAVLDAELIYAALPKQKSRLVLGQQAVFRARVKLKNPSTGEIYKTVFATAGDDSTASALGGLAGRLIENSVKGNQTDDQRFQKIADRFATVTLLRFKEKPEEN